MKVIKILHAADLHLDSPFEGLSASKAALRRSEQRALLGRIADLSAAEGVDLVFLCGDLLDSANTYYETGAELIRALSAINASVFIAPGNHDFYSSSSPYARLSLPENIHIFKSTDMERIELDELGVNVYGAAYIDSFTSPDIASFRAKSSDGMLDLLCVHSQTGFSPVDMRALENSGFDYAALGHIHKPSGLLKSGKTFYSWPGCPEGRGFDECGARYVNLITLSESRCELKQISVAARKYEILNVDVTDKEPLIAINSLMGESTASDIYRIILTGEAACAPEVDKLRANLSDLFFELQIIDRTHPPLDVWSSASEDSLRGLFVRKLKAQYDSALTDSERQLALQAARWGLAAIDNMEEIAKHEN